MRNLFNPEVDRFRRRDREVVEYYGGIGDETCGAFSVPSPVDGKEMRIVASSDAEWDHVSVSRRTRCPNWPEMEAVKRLFFKADETAMQLHVPPFDHINHHPYCLHLWRPHNQSIPRPPGWMVALDVDATSTPAPRHADCD